MVEFVVRSPGLHPWDAVCLTGDTDQLGRWQADALRLDWHDGTFRTHVDLPAGSHPKYLFTRGSWRNAELDFVGQEHASARCGPNPACGSRSRCPSAAFEQVGRGDTKSNHAADQMVDRHLVPAGARFDGKEQVDRK
jgi:hypothetical protein